MASAARHEIDVHGVVAVVAWWVHARRWLVLSLPGPSPSVPYLRTFMVHGDQSLVPGKMSSYRTNVCVRFSTDSENYRQIMPLVWKAMESPGREWRKVFKVR